MWTKICGLTEPGNTAAVCAIEGVAAVGLNFFEKSTRYIRGRQAVAVRQAVPDGVTPVGLFVNATPVTIRYVCERLMIDTVQLHGTEPPSLVRELAPLKVLRAIRVPNGRIADAVGMTLDAIGEAENLDAILLDAASTKGLGGTGDRIDWEELAECDRSGWPRVILAGGLTPENVGEAVSRVRPDGVDVASGVESEPGIKDAESVRQFLRNAAAI